jgi:hypothetical protein
MNYGSIRNFPQERAVFFPRPLITSCTISRKAEKLRVLLLMPASMDGVQSMHTGTARAPFVQLHEFATSAYLILAKVLKPTHMGISRDEWAVVPFPAPIAIGVCFLVKRD